MASKVGIRELRQNLSRHLERVKRGEALVVTERGKEVARLVPSGAGSDRYRELAERFGATVPTERLEDIVARLLGDWEKLDAAVRARAASMLRTGN